jgi:hypothetical protein
MQPQSVFLALLLVRPAVGVRLTAQVAPLVLFLMMVATVSLAAHLPASTIILALGSATLVLNCAMAALDLLPISAYHVDLPTNFI